MKLRIGICAKGWAFYLTEGSHSSPFGGEAGRGEELQDRQNRVGYFQ